MLVRVTFGHSVKLREFHVLFTSSSYLLLSIDEMGNSLSSH